MRLSPKLTYWLAALLCASLALLTARTAHAQATLPQFVADSQGRFAMSFPMDWEVTTRSEGMVAPKLTAK